MTPHSVKQDSSLHCQSTSALSSFQEFGFHIEYGLWTSSQCHELIHASQNLPSYKNTTLTPVMNPHNFDNRFLEAMRNPTVVQIMECLLSGKVSGLQSQFFFCRPGTPGFTRHQDNFYVHAKPDAFASAWIALEDVTPENGGLVVYPGSHREPILPTELVLQPETFGQDPNANCQQVSMPETYPSMDLYIPRGSVVFIHAHLVHASNKNITMNQFRHALLLTYIRKGESFRQGFSAKRCEIPVYSFES